MLVGIIQFTSTKAPNLQSKLQKLSRFLVSPIWKVAQSSSYHKCSQGLSTKNWLTCYDGFNFCGISRTLYSKLIVAKLCFLLVSSLTFARAWNFFSVCCVVLVSPHYWHQTDHTMTSLEAANQHQHLQQQQQQQQQEVKTNLKNGISTFISKKFCHFCDKV